MSAPARVAAASLLLLLLLSACTGVTGTPTPTPTPLPSTKESVQYPSVNPPTPQLYPVESVYDGDTLRVTRPDGTSQPVRVLGIDAPEMAAPPGTPASSGAPEDLDRYPECGATEARDEARSLLQGRSVALTEDPEQPSPDKYGRTLAYVSVDGKDLAAALLAAGWVQVFERYPVSRTSEYHSLQLAAQAAETGGWAMCGWTQ